MKTIPRSFMKETIMKRINPKKNVMTLDSAKHIIGWGRLRNSTSTQGESMHVIKTCLKFLL